jgi:outer membrane receptor for ferric coprogen and ferric-rhodotorulic acid
MHSRHTSSLLVPSSCSALRGIGYACAALATTTLPGWAQAQDSSISHYDIPAAPLASALNQFGQQAHLLLSFPEDVVAGRMSHPVKGDYSAESALQLLLQGSQIVAVRLPDGRYTFQRAADSSAMQLQATSISGMALGLTTEGTGSYTTGATTTATKLPLTLRETPQSVTVVTRQQMDDHGAPTSATSCATPPASLARPTTASAWSIPHGALPSPITSTTASTPSMTGCTTKARPT